MAAPNRYISDLSIEVLWSGVFQAKSQLNPDWRLNPGLVRSGQFKIVAILGNAWPKKRGFFKVLYRVAHIFWAALQALKA